MNVAGNDHYRETPRHGAIKKVRPHAHRTEAIQRASVPEFWADQLQVKTFWALRPLEKP
jgi:hypothetical protein